MNNWTIVVLLVLLIVFLFLFFRKRGLSNVSEIQWPFYAKKLLTRPEQVLYYRLIAAMPEHIVLAQVQLSRILGVQKGFNFHEWNNRINRMSLDFVVCRKDLTVVAAVELDDKTHEKKSRIEADARKNRALSSAGVPLIRWHVSDLPDEVTIRQTFSSLNKTPELSQ